MTWKERLKKEGWIVVDKEVTSLFNYCVKSFEVDELLLERRTLSIKHSVPTVNIVPIGFLEAWQEVRKC